MPLPFEDAHLARLHAGLQLELDRAVERLDRQRHAERGLHDRQVDLRVDVVPFADEPRIGLHADEHVDVAGATAERTRVSLAGDTDALPVVDAGGNVDVELAALERAPCAVALGARMLDDLATALAGRARRRAHELAEHAARDLLQPPGAAQRSHRTGVVPGSTPSPLHRAHVAATSNGTATVVPRAASTSSIAISAPRSAPRWLRPARAAAEQVVAEERREQVAEPAHVEVRRREAAGAEPRVAVAVVQRARLRVRRAPRTPRSPRGSAPRRRARSTRRDEAAGRAAGTPS